ncbi:restriction endonuclease subunit S [Helicobacter pylori]|nr:restriction endonuclease subunit S [Helicobacter pylori]
MDALTTPLPKNWEAVKVEDIFEIITDFSAAGSFAQQSQMVQYTNDRTNYAQLIRTTELKNGFNNTNAIYINKEAFEFLWRVNLNSDAIILPNIGINCGEIYYVDIKKLIHKHNALAPNAILLRTKKANLKFLFYAFLDTLFQKQLINIITSSAQPKFTKTDLRDLLIPLPPLNEQIAIANILSDLDRYLYSLDALILKKESVKKALSFELLSQRKRLKGFNQNWQRVRLGDILSYEQPTKYLVATTQYLQKGFTPILTAGKTFILGYTNDKHGIYTNIPVIIFDDFTTDSKMVNFPFKVKSSAIKILSLRDNNQADLKYIYEKLTLLKHQVTDHKRYWIDEFSDFEIFLPPLNEQIAIANILSALDSEIISLKNKKRQFENIKKALNHDLMSAKIRILKK